MINKEEITEIIRKLSYTGYTEQDIKSEAIRIIENLQKKAELGEHYKHLYSEVKKQKDNVVEYIKNNTYFKDNAVKTMIFGDFSKDLLRMLGEIDVED